MALLGEAASSDDFYVKRSTTFAEQPALKNAVCRKYPVTVDGAEVFRSDIVAKDDIPRMNFWLCLVKLLQAMISM